MEVYLEMVVILNFLVNFFLLLGTNRLSGFPPEPGRCALAAAVGAAYSGACLLPDFRFLGSAPWRIVILCTLAVVAFGYDRAAMKRGGVFVLLNMAMGGVAVWVGKGDVLSAALAAALIWLLCRLAFGDGAGRQEYIPVTLTYGENTVQVTALRDSGNTLHDPVTGEQVLVISGAVAEKLTGLTHQQLSAPLETLAQRPVPGLRLIPYRAVGHTGLLLALRFEQAKIGSRLQSTIAAFAPEGLGEETMYQALTGGVL